MSSTLFALKKKAPWSSTRNTNRRAWKFFLLLTKTKLHNNEFLCALCSRYFPQFVMEFHHVIPGKEINRIIRERHWDISKPDHVEYLTKEVQKCIALCANCHRLVEKQVLGHMIPEEGDNYVYT